MACCGQNRDFLKANPSTATLPRTNEPIGAAAASLQDEGRPATAPSFINLRYLESSTILVAGPASGRQYRFSSAQPIQAVDSRDVVALLRTRFFARA